MQGQWIGNLDGPAGGAVIVDLDDNQPGGKGSAFLFPDDPTLPGTYAELTIADDSQEHILRNVPITALDRASGDLLRSDQDIAERYENAAHTRHAEIFMNINKENEISVRFTTNISEGSGILYPSQAEAPSEVQRLADIQTWQQFKERVLDQKPYEMIYRGNRAKTGSEHHSTVHQGKI